MKNADTGPRIPRATETIAAGNILAAGQRVTVTAVPGALVGGHPIVTPRAALTAGLQLAESWVSAANAVSWVINNPTAGPLDPGAAAFDIIVVPAE
jgi:hypothetical protein